MRKEDLPAILTIGTIQTVVIPMTDTCVTMMTGEGAVIEEEMKGGEMIEGERIKEEMTESPVNDLEDDNREYTRRRHSL